MSERSEFGLRAPLTEKHRGPTRLHRVGSRPATAFLLTFGKTKVSRATARKLCSCFCIQLPKIENPLQGFRPLRVRVPF